MENISRPEIKIKVVGVGGAGNNTITRLSELGVGGDGVELIAVNTDYQHLMTCVADRKILIGEETTRTFGAGNDPRLGEEAARESEQELKEALSDADIVFITAGFGKGTGTGATPVIAEIAKKLGAITVAFVTLPFNFEGKRRMIQALQGLEKLIKVVDTAIITHNQKLFELYPNLDVRAAFATLDDILASAIRDMVWVINNPGRVNVDFADLCSVLRNGGYGVVGFGESDTESRAKEAIEKALNNPLLDIDIRGAKGAMVNIITGEKLTTEELKTIIGTVDELLDTYANLIWGLAYCEDMGRKLRVSIIATGARPRFLDALEREYLKKEEKREEKKEETRKIVDESLGIEIL